MHSQPIHDDIQRPIDTWALDAIVSKIGAFFEGTHFDVLRLLDAQRALNDLRARAAFATVDAEQSDTRWTALHLLHCDRFAEMAPATRGRLLRVVEELLGLDRPDASAILGPGRLGAMRRKLIIDFNALMPVSSTVPRNPPVLWPPVEPADFAAFAQPLHSLPSPRRRGALSRLWDDIARGPRMLRAAETATVLPEVDPMGELRCA